MDEVIMFIAKLPEEEIRNLIVNFKESQNIYLFRKEHGYTFGQFRRIILLYNIKKECCL